MNDNVVDEAILEYLKYQSPYSILVNGKWGSGKTYYIKNILNKIINTKFEKKKIIYTSANGISSFEDIFNQILFNQFEISQNKNIKRGAKLVFELAKLASDFKVNGISVLDWISRTFKIIYRESVLDITDMIIVIDDIERIDFKKFSIDEFFGKINSIFTEHDQISIILVGDEIELIRKLKKCNSKADYKIIKEKTITRTIQFDLNISKLLPQLIAEICQDSDIKIKLSENKDFIFELLLEFKESNLRTIIFILQNLEKIIKIIGTDKFDQVSKHLITFSIFISKSYKDGILDQFDEIFNERILFLSRITDNSSNEDPKVELILQGLRKYSTYYHPFLSILNYIKLGFLKSEAIINEVDALLPTLSYQHPWNQDLNNLLNFSNLSDEEFKQSVIRAIYFLNQGKYDANSIMKLADLYFFLFERNVILGNIPVMEFGNLICTSLSNSKDHPNLSYIDSRFMLERYVQKYGEASKIVDCYNDVVLVIQERELCQNLKVLKDKLLNDIKHFEQHDFQFLASNLSLGNDVDIVDKYLTDMKFSNSFNMNLRNKWHLFDFSECKIDPKNNLNEFHLKLQAMNFDKDQIINYYITELGNFLKK